MAMYTRTYTSKQRREYLTDPWDTQLIILSFICIWLYSEYHHLPYIGIYRLFNEPCILLRSPDMLKEVMIRSFQYFQDNVIWVDNKRDDLAKCNPFIAKGENWRNMRNEILPIFTPNKVSLFHFYSFFFFFCCLFHFCHKFNANNDCISFPFQQHLMAVTPLCC